MYLISNILRNKIIEIIISDLTTGMRDTGRRPYTDVSLNNFIDANQTGISDTISEMINSYGIDGELEDLLTPENDWITEYLYDFITIPNEKEDE
jgi:hypothetical protein